MLDSVIRDWLEPSPLRGPCILVYIYIYNPVTGMVLFNWGLYPSKWD